MTTEILGLDEIVASQAQKEVPHNTALRQIEAWVRVLSITTTAPPATPAAGDTYIVPAGATGLWAGQDNKLAHYYGGSWKFRTPIRGPRPLVLDEGKAYFWDGAAWVAEGGDTADFLTQADADAAFDAIGAAAAAVSAHAAADDPHSQYLTQTEGDARYLRTIGAQPFDLTAFYPGVPGASAIVTRVPVARAVTFPAALTESIGRASVAATAQTDFDVQKNGVSAGTVRFAAGATVATFIAAGAITLAAGDILSILAPGTPDATLANVGIVLAGSR